MLEHGYWLLGVAGGSIALVAVIANAIVQQNRARLVPVRVRRTRHRH